MRVRPAREAEVGPVAELSARCFERGATADELRGELANEASVVLVAERDDGRLVGYAVLRVVADEAELHAVAVEPSARGRGVGTELLATVLEVGEARGGRSLYLEVRASNEAARRLYERAGFETVHRRAAYYADGEDARVMSRAIGTGRARPR